MRTEGGAISGYCATGSVQIESSPMPMMRIEITQAKTGLSMKKRAMKRVLNSDVWRGRADQLAAAGSLGAGS